jgi:Glycosyl transferase family 2
MRVDLYTVAWNEQRMLPFFFTHYAPWVERFVVFDDGSDDGTAEWLARQPKVDLRAFPPKGDSFVLAARTLWQSVWKESRGRADWVIVTNVDEFLCHPSGMGAYLERCKREGVTLVHPRGYEMVGARFPDPSASLVDSLPRGVASFGLDKRQLFDPRAIDEMNFAPGRHGCAPTGDVVLPAAVEASLLHYKYVDLQGYTIPRQRALAAKLLPGDVARGFGMQYRASDRHLLNYFAWLELHAAPVLPSAASA